MFLFYDLIYIILAIVYLPYFLLRLSRDRNYGEGFFMRLGVLPEQGIAGFSAKKIIWLHAVSVGEVIGAQGLIRDLLKGYPDYRLVVSTVTRTGNQIARKMAGGDYSVIYFPFDLNWIVRKIIDRINPVLFLAFETEIWPNFINYLFKKGIPLALVNGRISVGSFKGYNRVRFILRNILGKFDLFCMQSALDAQRIIALGASKEKVKITGNTKFDIQAADCEPQTIGLNLNPDEQLFVAGSTHLGEEEIILDVFRTVKQKFPNLRLLIAPRHPERTPQIEKLVSKYGFGTIRISQLSTQDHLPAVRHGAQSTMHNETVFILDTIGQLKAIYSLATVVFVGGSLIPHGGQNPIEPAILAKPILFGPHLSNFKEVTDVLLDRQAAILVASGRELKENLLRLLADSSERAEIGIRARQSVEISRGATRRCVNLIKEIFDKKGIIS